jgi:hypothetical protein
VRGETTLFVCLLNDVPTDHDAVIHTEKVIAVSKLLLEYKADIQVRDKYGTTIAEALKQPVTLVPRAVQQWMESQFGCAEHFQEYDDGV